MGKSLALSRARVAAPVAAPVAALRRCQHIFIVHEILFFSVATAPVAPDGTPSWSAPPGTLSFPTFASSRRSAQVQHTATHCNILQHIATHCNTLQHTATHCSILQHTARLCDALQHTATHCNTLQHTATHCNGLCVGNSWNGQ